MGRSFLPTTDEGLESFALNFSTLLTANYAAYDIEQIVATTYASKYNAYKTALAAAKQPPTRGNATVLAKDEAKQDLTAYTRQVARTIGNNMDVTDAQRQALGLTIRKTKPTPIPAPTGRPSMDIVSVAARTVTISIHNGSKTKRAKPAGSISAFVYTFVGESYPTDPTLWQFQGPATKSPYAIVFPDSVASGAQVWICAAWVNRRGESGLVSVPITTNIQGGGVIASANMKIAA